MNSQLNFVPGKPIFENKYSTTKLGCRFNS